MMIMGNFKKMYIGAIESEHEAACLYDKIAILVHGLRVSSISLLFRRKRIFPTGSLKSKAFLTSSTFYCRRQTSPRQADSREIVIYIRPDPI
jgi:hypothetical protein